VDAAWGGYLATLFRNEDGSLRERSEVAAEFGNFPAAHVHAAIASLGHCDSVTVDPHKLGYLPFGAGAFVCRDNRAMALLAERADYVFARNAPSDYLKRFRNLGQYIPEGSKPGAAAAAVYVTHKVLPLDHVHFGRLPAATLSATELFYKRARRFAEDMASHAHVMVPYVPDSNLVCLAMNPLGNHLLLQANAFVHGLHEELRCDPTHPLQLKEFFGSITSLHPERLGDTETKRIFDGLGLDVASIAEDDNDDGLIILRHTLMNPFLIDVENDISYIELYFDFLARRVREMTAALNVTELDNRRAHHARKPRKRH